MNDVRWGVYSTCLLIGSLQGFAVAGLLLAQRANRSANRFLACLLVAVALLITPYTLGFAGFYDAFPWLNFAPFYWQLAFGPLIWLYVRQLGRTALPPMWALHFVPVAIEGAYYTAVWLCVPTASKEAWNDAFHVRFVLPSFQLATYVSYLVYAIATERAFRSYRRWLASSTATGDEFRLSWLRLLLVVLGALALWTIAIGVYDRLVAPLSYQSQFPLYLAFAVAVWLMGLEGWRQASRAYPKMEESRADDAADAGPRESSADRDWSQTAAAWIARIREAGWWREPDLTLARLANHLGTNTTYLSRALNEGAGMSFSTCINRMRVAEAMERLPEAGNILDLAFDVGFASKASFHRAFKAETGLTPTEFRAQHAVRRLES